MRLLHANTLAAFVVVAGCASLPRAAIETLRYDVGRGSRSDIESVVPDMLARYGYRMDQRRDTGRRMYYQTAWLHREPFEDEDRCAINCRSRIIVEARRMGVRFYSVTLRAENSAFEVAPGGTETWGSYPATEMFREHVTELAEEIGMKIDAGVRRGDR